MNRLLRTVLLLVGVALPLGAQTFSSNVRVNDDPAGTRQTAPQIGVDRNGTVYVVWSDFTTNPDGDIYLSRSTDRGVTFASKTAVFQGGVVPSGMQRGAQLAIDSRGTLHLVWMGSNGGYDIFYTRSTDGGATFTVPVPISGDSAKHNQDLPSIAIDAADNIYVAFVDDREKANGLSSNTQIYCTKSTDGGKTFVPAIRASNMPGGAGGSCECCNTSIAATGNGHVYIAFRSNIKDRRDIFIARSLDGGTTFDTAIPAASEQWILNACPMSGSTIALDREETAHVMWRDSRPSSGGRSYVYYTTLRYGDSACAPDVRISDTKSTFPSLTITPDGAMLCAYQHTRSDAGDVIYHYSLDGGNTFTSGAKLSDESGATLQELAITTTGPDGTRYAVWADSRRDAGDIVLARDTSQLSLVLPGPVQPMLPQNGSVINDFQTFLWAPPANLGDARNVIYDLTYEIGGKRTEVRNIRNGFYSVVLEPGAYRWWISARTMLGRSIVVDTLEFTVQGASSVATQELSVPSCSIRPNPVLSAGHGTLRMNWSHHSGSASILDMSGRSVAMLSLEAGRREGDEMVLDLPALPSGIYRVVVQTTDGSESMPLIVLR